MGKRHKKKTHIPIDTEEENKIPKAIVFRRNKVGPSLTRLMMDLREVLLPYTAPKLKDKLSNTIKDFVNIAGPYGVTHFLMLTGTEVGSYLRIARVPQGPTLTFRIVQYSHSADVRTIQSNPHTLGHEFHFPPVLVMSGFKEKTAIQHIDLMRITFKEIFPAISVRNIDLDHCRRCVLFHYDEKSDTVEFRHYLINAQITGLNKSIKRVLDLKNPDLANYNDISDYVLSGLGNTESDNEAQDSKIVDSRKRESRKAGKGGTTKTVRLHEFGPRMKLQLIKVEEELCSGTVRYHKFVVKTEAEIREMKIRINARKQREAHLRKLKEKRESEKALEQEQNNTKSGEVSTRSDADADADEDVEWYRSEVGEEPDEETKQNLRKASRSEKTRVLPQKYKKRKWATTTSTSTTTGKQTTATNDDERANKKRKTKSSSKKSFKTKQRKTKSLKNK